MISKIHETIYAKRIESMTAQTDIHVGTHPNFEKFMCSSANMKALLLVVSCSIKQTPSLTTSTS